MIPAFIFGITFFVYMFTLAPTLSFFDSGSLIGGAYGLGINHPPGYPVYATTGKLFTFLPLGNIAFRINVHSAFFASMTSVMVYYITRAMLGQKTEESERDLPGLSLKWLGIPELAGIFAALAFGYSYTLWAWTVVSKFYTLNAFAASCMVYLLLKWRRKVSDGEDSRRYMYFFMFLAGIGGAIHISQYPLYVAYAIFIVLVITLTSLSRDVKTTVFKWVNPRFIAVAAALFILGHSVNLHLPVRAMQDPLIDWGDPDTFSQFKWLYNREGYPPVGGERSLDLLMKQIKSFDLIREFGWAGIVLIAGGIVGHLRKDWLNVFLLLLASGGLTTAVIYMGNPPEPNIFLLEQFYIPVYVFLSVLIGGSAYEIFRRGSLAPAILALSIPFMILGRMPVEYIKKTFSNANVIVEDPVFFGGVHPPYMYFVVYFAMAVALFGLFWYIFSKNRSLKPVLLLLSFMVAFVLYPADQIRAHYHKNDRHENFIAFDMANAELTFPPENTVLFTWGDSGAFPMWYLQYVEQKRPDMLLVHTPHLNLEWFLYSIMRTKPELNDKSAIAEDYTKLKEYNGIAGVRQMLMVPDYMREPSLMIRKLIDLNPDRPFAWDYSSRYSIYNPGNKRGPREPWELRPYGIVYMKPGPDYGTQNTRIWSYLQTRGLPNPRVALDLDETKAVAIYGYIHMDIGFQYLRTGYEPLARQEFEKAIAYAPDTRYQLSRYLNMPGAAPAQKGLTGKPKNH